MSSFLVVYVGLAVLGLTMTWAEHSRVVWARARRVDWLWWLFSPLVTGTFTRAVTWGLVVVLAWSGVHFAPLAWPLAAQVPVALVVADVVGYASHRLRHTRALWPFHAVHHSPRALDWLAAARMHPIDDVIDNVLVGVAVLACGFDARIVTFLGPFLILHTIVLHADVPWTFGALAKIVASPAFHRRHHARDLPAANFAQLFAFIDVLGGTYDTYDGRGAERHGVDDELPDSLRGQLAWPFVSMWKRIT